MRVFIDTNILISSLVWPGSKPARAYNKAVDSPNIGIICDYSIREMRNTVSKKFLAYLLTMEDFLSTAVLSLKVVSVPAEECEEEKLIRDPKDRPILRAAINAHADILLTGDKDFLEACITHPRIMNASEFLELN